MTDPHWNDVTLAMEIAPKLNHCRAIGLQVVSYERGVVVMELPYSEQIVGNPETGVISGGAITTLLDTDCGFAAITVLDEITVTPTLDLRIDYLKAAEPGKPVIARGEVYRVSQHVIFTRGIAYQDDPSQPIANCTANYMRLDPELNRQATAMLREAVKQWLPQ